MVVVRGGRSVVMGCCCSSEETAISARTYRKAETIRSKKGEEDNARHYVALWNYEKSSNAELSFQKGDMFQEVGEECDAGPEWMFVTQESEKGACRIRRDPKGSTACVGTGTGYIPRNYVALRESLDAQEYWFGEMSREEADEVLKGSPSGTFLVRSRMGETTSMRQYALSICHRGKVKHFRIRSGLDKTGAKTFSIAGRRCPSVMALIESVKKNNRRLGCPLTSPPPRPPPKPCALSAEIEKHWREIPREQIRIECEIGKGFYGVVHRGTWEPSAGVILAVAIKELKKGLMQGRATFLAEAMAMKNLRHDRLVKLHGVVSTIEPFYIITEYIRDGSLRFYLKRRAREGRYLEETQMVEILCQVAEGMRYLEEKKVVHRDLAARNVLIQETEAPSNADHSMSMSGISRVNKFDVKIADFGLATMIKTGRAMQETQSLNLPTKWMSPEAIMEGKFSIASDVWSFGIVLHEVFTHGSEPYSDMNAQQTRQYVIVEKQLLKRPPTMPEKMYSLFMHCCEYEYHARPMFANVVTFLRSYYNRPGTEDYYSKSAYEKTRGE